jgi:hypothetical protein
MLLLLLLLQAASAAAAVHRRWWLSQARCEAAAAAARSYILLTRECLLPQPAAATVFPTSHTQVSLPIGGLLRTHVTAALQRHHVTNV